MDEYLYSPIVDSLLEWGKTRLLFSGHDEYLMEIREFLFSLPEADVEKELTPELSGIIDSASHGKNALANPDLITATPDDDIWTEAEHAFFLFDQLVFLREAVGHLMPDYNKGLKKRYLPELDRILSGISSWLYGSGEFSPLRLTVLNKLRKARLENIPKEKQYIFPWYVLFVENEAPLDWMIDNFDILQQPVSDRDIPPEIKENINVYVAELSYDRELAKVLEAEFRFSRSIEKIVADNLSLRLFALCKISATKYLVPEIVEKAGLERTAILLIKEMPRITVGDRVALVLQAAFCGPSLNDTQRLDAFSWVEENLKNVIAAVENSNTNQVLNALQSWIDGKTADDIFADNMFKLWIEGLEHKVEFGRVAQPEDDVFQVFVEGVMREELDSISEDYNDVYMPAHRAGIGEPGEPWWKEGLDDRSRVSGEEPWKEKSVIKSLIALQSSKSLTAYSSEYGLDVSRGDTDTEVQKRGIDQYVIGDRMVFCVEAPDNGHVVIFHCDQTGKVQLVFPHTSNDNTSVAGGSEKRIRGTVTKPSGRQLFKAIWTSRQLIEPGEVDFDDELEIEKAIARFIHELAELAEDDWQEVVYEFEVVEV